VVVRVHERVHHVGARFERVRLVVSGHFEHIHIHRNIIINHILIIIRQKLIRVIIHLGRKLIPQPYQLENLPARRTPLHRPVPQHENQILMCLVIVFIGRSGASHVSERCVGCENQMRVVDGAEIGLGGGLELVVSLNVVRVVDKQSLPFLSDFVEGFFGCVDHGVVV